MNWFCVSALVVVVLGCVCAGCVSVWFRGWGGCVRVGGGTYSNQVQSDQPIICLTTKSKD